MNIREVIKAVREIEKSSDVVVIRHNLITSSIEEAEDLKAWLNSHRTVSCMHEDFIAAIDRAAQDGIITPDETAVLANGAAALIESLGAATPTAATDSPAKTTPGK